MLVSRDFVLKRISPYISLTKKSTKNIYGKDYRIIHNDNAIEMEHIEILIDNKTFMAFNMEVKRNVKSFSKVFLDMEVGMFEDSEKKEEISFKINLDTKIKILVLPEQHHIFSKEKFNIVYPIFGNIENPCNWRQNEFELASLIEKKIEGRLFYEADLVSNNTEREITDLRYSYKKTLNKHLFIPREKILKYYKYEEEV